MSVERVFDDADSAGDNGSMNHCTVHIHPPFPSSKRRNFPQPHIGNSTVQPTFKLKNLLSEVVMRSKYAENDRMIRLISRCNWADVMPHMGFGKSSVHTISSRAMRGGRSKGWPTKTGVMTSPFSKKRLRGVIPCSA